MINYLKVIRTKMSLLNGV